MDPDLQCVDQCAVQFRSLDFRKGRNEMGKFCFEHQSQLVTRGNKERDRAAR
jgi:hypothetical protein